MQAVRDLKLAVDENNLLNEWKGQAQMMLDYGVRLADAMQEEDEARAALDMVKAKLDAEVRADPSQFNIDKITENVVAATVLKQPEYTVAEKARLAAIHEVRLLRAAVDALAHRKSTLQGMTDLFLRQWYADPKSPAQPAELREAAGAGAPPTKVIPGRTRRRGREE